MGKILNILDIFNIVQLGELIFSKWLMYDVTTLCIGLKKSIQSERKTSGFNGTEYEKSSDMF